MVPEMRKQAINAGAKLILPRIDLAGASF